MLHDEAGLAVRTHHASLDVPVVCVLFQVLGDPVGTIDQGVEPGLATVGRDLQALARCQLGAQHTVHQATEAAVVGDEVLAVVTGVLAHMGQTGDLERTVTGEDDHLERFGRFAAASGALSHDGEVVNAIGQVALWREAPVALVICLCATHLDALVVDDHGSERIAATGDARTGVVGDIAGQQVADFTASVVVNRLDNRLRRQCEVDHQLEGIGRLGDVARGVDGLHGDAVLAFGQRLLRGERPGAVLGDHAADFHAVVIDDDGCAGFGSTGEGRLLVVGDIASGQFAGLGAHVVDDAANGRCFRRLGIDGDDPLIGRLGLVASRILDDHADAMVAVAQIGFRSEFPGAVFTDFNFTDLGAVVVDDDGVARVTVALDGRLAVIGDAAFSDRAGDAALVVDDFADASAFRTVHRRFRRGGVDHQLEGIGRLGDVARGVDGLHGDAVLAFGQRLLRGERPGAVLGDHAADFHAVVIDDDGCAGFGSTGEGRLLVVGDIASGQFAGLGAHVVDDAANGRCFRRLGIDGDDPLIGRLGLVACFVFDDYGDRVFTLAQRRRGEAPGAIRLDRSAADQVAIIVDMDGVARFPGAIEGRGCVVGDAAVLDRTLNGAHIVEHFIDAMAIGARLAWRSHVEAEIELRAACAFAGCFCDDRGAERVITFFQLRRSEAPVARGVALGAANLDTVVVDDHGGIGGRTAAQQWRFVVGDAALGDWPLLAAMIVEDSIDGYFDRTGVDGEVDRLAAITDVTGTVDEFDAQAVLAIGQCRVRCEAPITVLVGLHAADFHAIVVDDDSSVGFVRRALEGRLSIVGGVAVYDRTLNGAHIVQQFAGLDEVRSYGVDDQGIDASFRTRNHIAGQVGSGHAEVVQALWQILAGREGPLALSIASGGAQRYAVAIDGNDDTRCRGTI